MNGIDTSLEDQFLPPSLVLKDKKKAAEIESILAPLRIGGSTLLQVMKVFKEEMKRGLAQQPSSLQMENTYVPELPDGSEQGLFLALDLGGTNFRVLLLEIEDGKFIREDVKQYHVSDELRFANGELLFDFLAECVGDFVRSEGLEDVILPLGFTFSFPMLQHNLASGNLITWTKSFNCPGMEGRDVVEMLTNSLKRAGVGNVHVVALLNDTTGTLVAGARIDSRTRISVIVGTGSNGCYLERASRVQHWEASHEAVQDVVVDIEWGAFGDNGCLDFIKSSFDKEVDEASLLVNSFTFEKYIGGKYLGEIARSALSALAKRGLVSAAPQPTVLTTTHISQIELDTEAGLVDNTCELLSRLCAVDSVTEEDAYVAQHVCRLVSNRAAQLVSVCIATVLRRVDRDFVTVAVDGSVFKCHPKLRGLMDKYIALLAPEHPFTLILAEDGSGKGAALTAAVAQRLLAKSKKNSL